MTFKLRSRCEQVVSIPIEESILQGDLQAIRNALGVVIFVHGSGSSRFSVRRQQFAEELNKRGLSTVLPDLLTKEEQRIDAETMQYRLDIPLLVSRSTLAACWVHQQPELSQLPIGLFGTNTGAAAAMITAVVMKHEIAAVVSCGGRLDLVEEGLKLVEAPTLLIVGSEDKTVLDLNQQAATRMYCPNKLHVVPGATHLFEELGTLDHLVKVAAEWFVTNMRSRTLNHRARG